MLSSAPRYPAILAIAMVSLGATCENQDYFTSRELTLEGKGPYEPVAVELSQPYRGLNSLDFVISNTGSRRSPFGLGVSVCSECQYDADCTGDLACSAEAGEPFGLPDSVGLCRAEGEADPCTEASVRVTGSLEPGEQTSGRFDEGEMGLADHIHVEFLCTRECEDDLDCGAGEDCDSETGLCLSPGDDPASVDGCSGRLQFTVVLRQVECRDDTDCDSDEICDAELGFCTTAPEIETGCQVVPAQRRNGGGAAVVLLLALLLTARRRGGLGSAH